MSQKLNFGDKKSSILIVGGGAWGLSISLELARNGYRDVTVVDLYPIPSPISAANDVNKIARTYHGLTDGSLKARANEKTLNLASDYWLHDPVYKHLYHETGMILASSSPKALAGLKKGEELDSNPEYKPLKSAEDFRSTMPEGVLTGDFPKWTGWHRSTGAGWCHARKTLESVHHEAKKWGVKFITGTNGDISHLLYKDGKVIGAKCKNGAEHIADLVILSAGGFANELFDFKGQLRPTAWTLGHIKMTPEELSLYKDLPPLFNNELGFFMEPDEDRHELKICDEHPGYCNWVPDDQLPAEVPGGPRDLGRSIPFARHGIPEESEKRIRLFLKATMPHLADRELCFGRICWDADTPDRSFLIDRVPGYEDSLLVAVGASGHGFANMPAIGKIVLSILNGCVDPVFKEAFRWRPETAVNRDVHDTLGRFGAGNTIMDFQKVERWVDLPYKD